MFELIAPNCNCEETIAKSDGLFGADWIQIIGENVLPNTTYFLVDTKTKCIVKRFQTNDHNLIEEVNP